MSARRNRVVRSFSFRLLDMALFKEARERAEKHAPGANDSELVRMALEVLALAPEPLVRRVAMTLERVESGRPSALVPPPAVGTNAWEEELLGDEGRVRRLALFEELEMLKEGPRGEKWVEERIETLCRYFGMIYRPKE